MKKILICLLISFSVNVYASIPIDIHWQTPDGCHFRLKGDLTYVPGDPTGYQAGGVCCFHFDGTITGWGGPNCFTGHGPVHWFYSPNAPANGIYFELDRNDLCEATQIRFSSNNNNFQIAVTFLNTVSQDILLEFNRVLCKN